MASSSASVRERKAPRRLARAVLAAAVAVSPAAFAASSDPVAPPAASAPPPAAGAARDLSALLRGMRSSVGVIAQFTETKQLALLSSPLVATGTIYFLPPGRLVRVVTSPGSSRLVVNGDRVRFEDESGSKALDLSASPVARQMIDSFVVLFNGNEERLKQLYDASFEADENTWHLHLTPRASPLDRMIASFDLYGSGARIDRMEAREPDGDSTVTRFGETDAQHRFSEKELADLFGEPPVP